MAVNKISKTDLSLINGIAGRPVADLAKINDEGIGGGGFIPDIFGDSSCKYAFDYEDNLTELINDAAPTSTVGTITYADDKFATGKSAVFTSTQTQQYAITTTLTFPFTVSAWIYAPTGMPAGAIFDNNFRMINMAPAYIKAYSQQTGRRFNPTFLLNLDAWNLLIVDFLSVDVTNMWLNGVKETPSYSANNDTYSSSNLCIGSRDNYRDTRFAGKLDRYRIFNRDITDGEAAILLAEFNGS